MANGRCHLRTRLLAVFVLSLSLSAAPRAHALRSPFASQQSKAKASSTDSLSFTDFSWLLGGQKQQQEQQRQQAEGGVTVADENGAEGSADVLEVVGAVEEGSDDDAPRRARPHARILETSPCGTCQANATCVVVNNVATCQCNTGFNLINGACVDPCWGVRCPDISTCTTVQGAPVCTCPAGYARLLNNVCSNDPLPFSDYLDPHNAARAAVGSVPLQWDATVAWNAQNWANQLANSTYNCNTLVHGNKTGYGQNLAAACCSSGYSDTKPVNMWVAEGRLYGFALFSGGCTTGNWADCGHYTQVIWNNTRFVGCGRASCSNGWTVWACDYSGPGNYVGQYPYVRDPCFGFACPYPAVCNGSSGVGYCMCPPGQVFSSTLNQCISDPCVGVVCPGNQVCNGTSGTAVCGCRTGQVPIDPTTCIYPACQGIACPANSYCNVNKGGYPFCQCNDGYSMVGGQGGTCVLGASASAMATSLVLYNATGYTNNPSTLKPAVVRAAVRGSACTNIPPGFNATLNSFRVLWNVPEPIVAGSTRQVCGTIWFWNNVNCYGSAIGWSNPDKTSDVTSNFSPASANAIIAKSINCKL